MGKLILWLGLFLALTTKAWSYEVYNSFTPTPTTDQIWNSLMSRTQDPRIAAMVMGNMGIESSFDVDAINEEENAFGLFQLRKDRLDNFRLFQEANPDMSLIDQQVAFMYEQNDPNSQYTDAIAAKNWSDITGQDTTQDMARLFDKYWERSAGWMNPEGGYNPMGATTRDRMELSNRILDYYKNNKPQAPKEEPKNLIGKIRDKLTDPDFSDDVRLWANSMRYKPDQGLALSLMEAKKARESKRLLNLQRNATMSFVNKMPEGSEKNMFMAAIQSGADGKDIMSMLTENKKMIFDNETKMSAEFDKHLNVKKFYGRADALRTILSNAREPSQGGDVAIVYTFMKMLDPTSTVNKGELAMAQNVGSIPTRIASLYNSLLVGDVNLRPNQRAGLVNAAKQVYDESRVAYEATKDHYVNKALEYGYKPERFLQKYGLNEEQYTDLQKITTKFDAKLDKQEKAREVPFTDSEFDFESFENWFIKTSPENAELYKKMGPVGKWEFIKKLYWQYPEDQREQKFKNFRIN